MTETQRHCIMVTSHIPQFIRHTSRQAINANTKQNKHNTESIGGIHEHSHGQGTNRQPK